MSDTTQLNTSSHAHRTRTRGLLYVLAAITMVAGAIALTIEMRTSLLQAGAAVRYAASLDYTLGSGPSDAIRFPQHGPFNTRLGYAHLPRFTERLTRRDYEVAHQTRFAPELLAHVERGFFPPYREKTRTGLQLTGARGERLYHFAYPQHGYEAFRDIPPVVVATLLFIENRELLDAERPFLNPAVDWPRFARAGFAQLQRMVSPGIDAPGASTLATQIEKYRHSPDGVTHSSHEKLRQMVSASVRAYRNGQDTLAVREALVHDYLNTVPLSAAPGYGEIHGLGDGLWVWYGADFDRVNALLTTPSDAGSEELVQQGLAFRQVLSLLIAHRRPSHYLGRGRSALSDVTESHLRVLARAGVISPALRDAALAARPEFRDAWGVPLRVSVDADRGATTLRNRLAALLGVSLYELDRLDLQVSATLDQALQQAVSAHLTDLGNADSARTAGLIGPRLLSSAQLKDVYYSFTLFEITPDGNRVRVQTDTTDQPLDINEGSKLELGSTAKLRVLATYLEIVAELHARHAGKTRDELRQTEVDRLDVLSRWALEYLARSNDRNLPAMLEAALARRYSASPAESYFTGGGVHRFSNFRNEDNGRQPTVQEALQESINLPFVRLMRDIVRHAIYQVPGSSATLLGDDGDDRRLEYLARFADHEGRVFLGRFWRKYRGQTPDEMRATLLDGLHPTPERLAAVFRYIEPNATTEDFAAFLNVRLPAVHLTPARLARLYQRHAPGQFDLPDQGYIARVHPLELWLVAYLSRHPDASFSEVVEASREERQQVYRWLFRTRAKSAQDRRIHTMLEVEAFLDIHRRWAQLGYPFNSLVPSLATALGSSGDRPAALAELLGIILNDGEHRPAVRIERLEFGADTPYHTQFVHRPRPGTRVMAPEVAAALRTALSDVVEGGTARRLAGAFKSEDGSIITVGGKTGTGDNRIVIGAGRGQTRGGIALNRTATFAFHLGPRHFGTLTAYVTGPEAASFRFTSALPVQILKSLGPILIPYVEAAERDTEAAPGLAPAVNHGNSRGIAEDPSGFTD